MKGRDLKISNIIRHNLLKRQRYQQQNSRCHSLEAIDYNKSKSYPSKVENRRTKR